MRILLVAAVLAASACFPVTHVDYVDFIKANGVMYLASDYAGDERLGRALTDADLGAEQFRVKQRLTDGSRPGGYLPVDGDAAFVAAGEPVYAVKGYATTFRLAARRDGRIVTYEADSNPAAKSGRDLLDLDGKVRSLALLSQKDGRTVLGRITDPARMRELVALVLAAPVDQSPPPLRPGWATVPPGMPTQPIVPPQTSVFVAFELSDGTATRRSYDLVNGILHRGIQVAGAFRTTVEELVAAAPTPTPVPATLNLTKRYDLARATRATVKSAESGVRQDPSLAARLATALDVELPARAATQRPNTTPPVIIFELADRIVSLVYDREADLLIVVAPQDEFGVVPTSAVRDLLDPASLERAR
jgi:hypothetical protein